MEEGRELSTVPPPPVPQRHLNRMHPREPSHAAVPYSSAVSHPVQDTSPPLDALPEGASPAPPPSETNGPQPTSSQGGEDNESDCEEKNSPEQETDPAPQALNNPQTTEQEDVEAVQMDQAGVDPLH